MKRFMVSTLTKRAFLRKLMCSSQFYREGQWASAEMRLLFSVFAQALDDFVSEATSNTKDGDEFFDDFFTAGSYLIKGGLLDVLGIDPEYVRRIWTEMIGATQPKLVA
jgi:hypothetical protein